MNESRSLLFEFEGTVYRSTLEAKWAIALYSMGIRVEYEPASYPTPGGLYVPDFWLPEAKHFLEVKPLPPKPEELAKACGLQDLYPFRRVLFLVGFPWLRKGLCNAGVYSVIGDLVRASDSLEGNILFAFGLDNTPENQERLILCIHHAYVIARNSHKSLFNSHESIQSVLRRRLSWPDIAKNVRGESTS